MFTQKRNWSAERALKLYRSLAVSPLSGTWEVRYNWARSDQDGALQGFTQAEVDAIYAEVIAKIPAEATKVLELGCGDGRFAAALRAARPAIGYRGLDLVVENVEAAQAALPAEEFVAGTAEEYLSQATVDWDFVVSIHCMFSCTNTKGRDLFFQILDAKASRGFLLVADLDQAAALETLFTAAVGTSTNVAESYISGARAYLTDATLKSVLAPILLVRDSTSAEAPALPQRYCVVERGEYSKLVARHASRKELRAGNSAPADVKAVTAKTGGLITSFGTKSIEAEWVENLKVARKPVVRSVEDPA